MPVRSFLIEGSTRTVMAVFCVLREHHVLLFPTNAELFRALLMTGVRGAVDLPARLVKHLRREPMGLCRTKVLRRLSLWALLWFVFCRHRY